FICQNSGKFCMRNGGSSIKRAFAQPKVLQPGAAPTCKQAKPCQHEVRLFMFRLCILSRFRLTRASRPRLWCSRVLCRSLAATLSLYRFGSRRTHGTNTHRGEFSAPFTITLKGNVALEVTPASGNRKPSCVGLAIPKCPGV